jgi:hypothetical protein
VQITLVDRHNHGHIGLLGYADALLGLRANACKQKQKLGHFDARALVEKGFGKMGLGGVGDLRLLRPPK